MRTADEWAGAIRSGMGKFASAADLAAVEQALEEHPRSVLLWVLRGDLIQLEDPASDRYALSDALNSYRQALALDPASAEAHEEIGHYFDAIEDDPARALPFFERAVELGGGDSAEQALADVRAQLDEREPRDK